MKSSIENLPPNFNIFEPEFRKHWNGEKPKKYVLLAIDGKPRDETAERVI
jgi:hypothetical protein